jgi:3-methyladenine DNA glycosylase AlkD
MSIDELFNTIQDFCINEGSPEIVKKYSRFFKEGYDAYGIDRKAFSEKLKEWSKDFKSIPSEKEKIEFCNRLVSTGKYELLSLGIMFFKTVAKSLNTEYLEICKNWLDRYISNWAHADILCAEVIKPFIKKGAIEYTYFSEWKKSLSKWTRRAVPVSLIDLVKKDLSIHEEVLDFVEEFVDDSAREVHQGIGWMLREAWKKRNDAVEDFLFKIKDYSPRLIIQYATEKMKKEQKQRYKRAK